MHAILHFYERIGPDVESLRVPGAIGGYTLPDDDVSVLRRGSVGPDLAAFGLIVDGLSTTRYRLSCAREADVRLDR